MLKAVLSLATLVSSVMQIVACSCIGIHTFCDAVNRSRDWDPAQTLVAKGVVTGEIFVNEYRTDKVFRINKSYYNPADIEVIQIKEGNGANCGRSLGDLHIGDELVILTHVWDDSIISGSFSICMPPPLRVNGNRVTGQITRDETHTMSISRFERLQNCLDGGIAISVFPNPSTDWINVRKHGKLKDSHIANIEIFDALGRSVFQHTLSEKERESPDFQVNIGNWSSGTYFVTVAGLHGRNTQRVIVNH